MEKTAKQFLMGLVLAVSVFLVSCGSENSKVDVPLSTYEAAPVVFSSVVENVPGSDVEKIVVVINYDYTPGWKDQFQKTVLDKINTVFAKNTNKKFEVGSFLTYSKEEFGNLHNNPNYHNRNSDYGETTVIINIGPKSDRPPISGIGQPLTTAFTWHSFIEGVRHENIWLLFEVEDSAVYQNSSPFSDKWQNIFEKMGEILTHELGHPLGLGFFAELYLYEIPDTTGVEPLLGYYSLSETSKDPMAGGGSKFVDWTEMEFSELSSFIINNNPRRKYTSENISGMYAKKVVVRVIDKSGAPVSDAVVSVFGSTRGTGFEKIARAPFLESTITNKDGLASITPVDNQEWIAKTVKVKKDDRCGGSILTLLDSQTTFILKRNNIHTVDIIL